MKKKALHIYATGGKTNSGDFFLGPATKWKFEQDHKDEEISWSNFNVRKNVSEIDVKLFNTHDYIVVGGGGLLLPDTNPNIVSCWQWPISSNLLKKITSEIHVVSIGWNLFYGQTVCMPNRDSDFSVPKRKNIFKENLETLIKQSTSFTMRHKGDCEELKKIVSEDLHKKIKFNFCPVVEYVSKSHAPNFVNDKVYHVFEIKDDRPNRRYIKKSKNTFYNELLLYIKNLLSIGEKVAVMSHDGSKSFYKFLQSKNIKVPLLDNTVANEKKIIENYSKVKKLYCTAGHSQMTAHALGLDYYSLINHDKLKYFLQDNNMFIDQNYCLVNEENINEKLF